MYRQITVDSNLQFPAWKGPIYYRHTRKIMGQHQWPASNLLAASARAGGITYSREYSIYGKCSWFTDFLVTSTLITQLPICSSGAGVLLWESLYSSS